jgi:hypothetical protein
MYLLCVCFSPVNATGFFFKKVQCTYLCERIQPSASRSHVLLRRVTRVYSDVLTSLIRYKMLSAARDTVSFRRCIRHGWRTKES